MDISKAKQQNRRMSPNPLLCLMISQSLTIIKKNQNLQYARLILADGKGSPRFVNDKSWEKTVEVLRDENKISTIKLYGSGFPGRSLYRWKMIEHPIKNDLLLDTNDKASNLSWYITEIPPDKDTVKKIHRFGLNTWILDKNSNNDIFYKNFFDPLVKDAISIDNWSHWIWPISDIFVEALADHLMPTPAKSSLPTHLVQFKPIVFNYISSSVGGVSVLNNMVLAVLKKWDDLS